MKKLQLLAIALLVAYGLHDQWDRTESANRLAAAQSRAEHGSARIVRAFGARESDVQVVGTGVVSRLLADDLDGSAHQRFVLRLAGGHTILVAHNIDLAPRLAELQIGDEVAFNGEYEWNARGGVLHWTHHDPTGRHAPGWLRHQGRTYE